MRRDRVILHRVLALSVVVLIGAVGLSGCSSVGPEDAWSETASMEGSVTDTEGAGIEGIAIWLWTEADGGEEYSYRTATDASGDFWFEGVELATAGSNTEDYFLCVNRTNDSSQRIQTEYTTFRGVVTVSRESTCTEDVVLELVDEPGDPEIYFE